MLPHEQIDPIYFEHTYYVSPGAGLRAGCALLAKALERSRAGGASARSVMQ